LQNDLIFSIVKIQEPINFLRTIHEWEGKISTDKACVVQESKLLKKKEKTLAVVATRFL
jgi:hypothetical protein